MTQSLPCRICGSQQTERQLQAREKMFGLKGKFAYQLCAECGSLSLLDDGLDLSPFYPPEYYSFADNSKFGWKARATSGIARLLPDFLCSYLGQFSYSILSVSQIKTTLAAWLEKKHRHPRVLDVGCGSGAGLLPYHYAGCQVEGLDPYYQGENPDEFPIHRIQIAELEGCYDLISFNHSLEHVADPQSQLKHALRLLSPGGTCMVRVPKLPSGAFDQYQQDWFSLDAPRHYFIPSVTGLSALAKKVGFASIEATDEPYARGWLWSEVYHRGLVRHDTRLEQVLSNKDIEQLSKTAHTAFSQRRSCHGLFLMKKDQTTQ